MSDVERGEVARRSLRAVIFDLDGTLADTLPVCIAAFRRAYLEHAGRYFTDREIEALFGPNEVGSIRQVVPEARWDAALNTFLEEYEASHDRCTAPFPGMIELLDWLAARGIRTAVVTGKGDKSAQISLRRTGLLDRFTIVESGSPEGVIKPAGIRRALESWDIRPEEAAYVGDSPSDVTSARSAGVVPLSAAWTPSADPNALREMGPTALFYTVDELRAWLESRVISI